MRESQLEQLLFRLVRHAGGIAVKLAPTHVGVPDRLVLMPGSRSWLVELKAANGTVEPAQRLWHERAAALGHRVTVLRGREEIEHWVADVAVGACVECGNDSGPYGGLCLDCLETS